MRFQTPQFIEVEDKIFGPLTLKQFIYLIGTGGIAFILYTFLPGYISFLLIIPVAALGISLAFYKINNKPFIYTVEAAIRYIMNAKIYVWRKSPPKASGKDKEKEKKEKEAEDAARAMSMPRLSDSKLKEIAWGLDIHDIHEQREHESEKHKREQRV
jgi:hypothetical protein